MRHFSVVLLLTGAFATFAAADGLVETKLILVGCVADPQELLDDLDRVEELPFDGYLLHGYDNRNLPSGDLAIARSVFGPRLLKFEDYQRFIEATRQVQAANPKLTENLLKVGSLPGTLEKRDNINENYPRPGKDKVQMWGDDFDVVVNNFRVAAEVAKAAGMRGIQLDLEMYGGYFFDQRVLVGGDIEDLNQEQLNVRVRECGRDVMNAMQSGYPGLTVFLFFGYALVDNAHQPHYGLSQPFLDGLIEAASDDTSIVDGYEDYGMTTAEDFQDAYQRVHEVFRERCAVPDEYAARITAGFPVWPEVRIHRAKKKTGDAVNELLYTPNELYSALRNALNTSDRYVWVYSEASGRPGYPNWWTGENLPAGYIRATNMARLGAKP